MNQSFPIRGLLAAIAVAVGPLVQPAAAHAEWDIEKYDRCLTDPTKLDSECCIMSGGNWDKSGKCVAPPADEVSVPEPTRPGPLVPGSVFNPPGGVLTP